MVDSVEDTQNQTASTENPSLQAQAPASVVPPPRLSSIGNGIQQLQNLPGNFNQHNTPAGETQPTPNPMMGNWPTRALNNSMPQVSQHSTDNKNKSILF